MFRRTRLIPSLDRPLLCNNSPSTPRITLPPLLPNQSRPSLFLVVIGDFISTRHTARRSRLTRLFSRGRFIRRGRLHNLVIVPAK